jgi:hypothetical protein
MAASKTKYAARADFEIYSNFFTLKNMPACMFIHASKSG